MPRPKFTLKTLLWFLVVVAAFAAGATWQRESHEKQRQQWADQRAQFEDSMRKLAAENKVLTHDWVQTTRWLQEIADSEPENEQARFIQRKGNDLRGRLRAPQKRPTN